MLLLFVMLLLGLLLVLGHMLLGLLGDERVRGLFGSSSGKWTVKGILVAGAAARIAA